MKILRILLLFPFFFVATASARPLKTEEVAPVGFLNFEAGTSISYRTDQFGPDDRTYETVNFPVYFRFGVHPKAELGLEINYVDQKIEFAGSQLVGSTTGDFSPEFKISPWKYFGIKGIWHTQQSEDTDTDIPIGHGNDYELLALFKAPFEAVSLQLNTGYDWRGAYDSQVGVRAGPSLTIDPGTIFQTRASLEIPVGLNFNLLTELAYFTVAEQTIDSLPVQGSSGEAMDATAGITWAWGGWNIGTGVSFGLLEESHTSFDLQRGAGDWQYQLAIAYKIKPKKPEK